MADDYSGWLRFLDLTAEQAFAVAACAAGVIALHHYEVSVFREMPGWLVAIVATVGMLAVGLLLSKLASAAGGRWRRYQWRRHVLAHLETLSEVESQILAYLVTRNERSFTAHYGGQRANTLIAKGLVNLGNRETVTVMDSPYIVPEFVWQELVKRKDKFKWMGGTVQPWRDGW